LTPAGRHVVRVCAARKIVNAVQSASRAEFCHDVLGPPLDRIPAAPLFRHQPTPAVARKAEGCRHARAAIPDAFAINRNEFCGVCGVRISCLPRSAQVERSSPRRRGGLHDCKPSSASLIAGIAVGCRISLRLFRSDGPPSRADRPCTDRSRPPHACGRMRVDGRCFSRRYHAAWPPAGTGGAVRATK